MAPPLDLTLLRVFHGLILIYTTKITTFCKEAESRKVTSLLRELTNTFKKCYLIELAEKLRLWMSFFPKVKINLRPVLGS